MIKLTHVTKIFNNQNVIDNLDLTLPETGLVIVGGRIGSGKTVLLKLIAGLEKPNTGSIEVDKEIITSKSERHLTQYRKENISIIYNKEFLIDKLTVEENIALVSKDEKVSKIIETLNLKNILNKKVGALSHKEKSLVEVARGLVKKTKILLVDDPVILADSTYKTAILELLKEESESRLVILTTTDEKIKENYGNVVIHLVRGKLDKLTTRYVSQNKATIESAIPKFEHFKFANKVLFSNKKKIAKTSILFLLSLLCFLLSFSLFSVDYVDVETKTMVKEADTNQFIRKVEKEGDYYKYVNYTDEDIINLRNTLGMNLTVGKQINIENTLISFDLNYSSLEDTEPYYSVRLKDFQFLPTQACRELEVGTLPKRNDEIVISSYMADSIINFGIKDTSGNFYKPTSYEELVNQRHPIDLAGIGVYVSGIYELELDKFESLKEKFDDDLYARFNVYLSNNAPDIYVNDGFFTMYKDYKLSLQKQYSIVLIPGHEDLFGYEQGRDLGFKVFTNPVSIKRTDTPVDYLASDEIIINGSLLNDINKSPETAIGSVVELYIENSSTKKSEKLQSFKVVGISEDGNNYISKSIISEYLIDPIVLYEVRVKMDDESQIKTILTDYKEENGYYVTSDFTYIIKKLQATTPKVSLCLFVLGVILLLTSFIFMLNYIFYSIDDHKKDIGVLKSLGISNMDIYRTFGIEILTLIIKGYIFASIGYFILRIIINMTISHIVTFSIDILPIRLLLFVAIFLIVALISTIISTLYYIRIRKLKNVD